jgi:hypothetical protein
LTYRKLAWGLSKWPDASIVIRSAGLLTTTRIIITWSVGTGSTSKTIQGQAVAVAGDAAKPNRRKNMETMKITIDLNESRYHDFYRAAQNLGIKPTDLLHNLAKMLPLLMDITDLAISEGQADDFRQDAMVLDYITRTTHYRQIYDQLVAQRHNKKP